MQLTENLYKQKDWNARLDSVINLTPPEIVHSKRYQRLMITAGYCRVKAVLEQKSMTEGVLKATATLIRPTEITMQLSEDYGVSKVSK